MLVTLDGISIPVREMHLANANVPMDVTLFGISTISRLVQPSNSPDGITAALISEISVSAEQSANAHIPS